jgi:hypothetical protein
MSHNAGMLSGASAFVKSDTDILGAKHG